MISINGKAAEDVGLEVGRFSLRKRARQNYETINIPGKAVPNIVPLSSWSPVSIPIPADLLDYSRIDEVYEWLGSGKAVLIDERDPEKYRIGQCLEEVTVDCLNEDVCSLAMSFICEPFLYKTNEAAVKLVSNGNTVVTTPGIDTEPLFRVKITAGSTASDIQITTLTASSESEYFQVTVPDAVASGGLEITIDSAAQETYYTDSTGAKHSIGSMTVRNYPVLKGGGVNNTVGIYGNIESAEIELRTRWL